MGGAVLEFVFIRFRKSLLVFVLLFFSVRGLLLQVSYKGLMRLLYKLQVLTLTRENNRQFFNTEAWV